MVDELIKRIKKGDRDALYEVYKSYKEPFLMYCLTYHSFPKTKEGRQDVETIYHDIILKFRRICMNGTLEKLEKASLKTYLFSIGNNLIKNYFRDSKGGLNVDISAGAKDSVEYPAEDYDDFTLKVVTLLKSGRLGEPCTKILTYTFYDELSVAEIQKLLEFPTANAVSQRRIRCLASLRSLLNIA